MKSLEIIKLVAKPYALEMLEELKSPKRFKEGV